MLLLTGSSDEIRFSSDSVITSFHIHASWVDQAAGVFTPGRKNIVGSGFGLDLVIVPSPAPGVQRNVQTIIIRNPQGSNARISLRHFDGTNAVLIRDQLLLSGDHFLFMDGVGFRYFRIQSTANRLRLSSDFTTSSVTPIAAMTKTLLPGTWIFRYQLVYQTSASNVGVRIDVNFVGVIGGSPPNFVLYNARWVDSSALGSTSPSQNISSNGTGGTAGAGAIMSAFSRRTFSAVGIPTVGVDLPNADMLMTIEGVLEIVSATDVNLVFGSEVAANNVTLRAGSTAWFEPYFSVSGVV